MRASYSYKGYRYDPINDVEPDECIKIFHDVIKPDGKTIQMDWSPYSTPSESDFQLWIDLGCPGRIGYGTLNSQDLQKIKGKLP